MKLKVTRMELLDLSTSDTGEHVRDLSSVEVNIIDGPLFSNFAIVAHVDNSVQRVEFFKDGDSYWFVLFRRNFRTENNDPYALCNDDGGNPVKYEKCVFSEGSNS